tara:strand:+ start:160 stop:1338 length:1179 start_codon:yes stop_codon:yes gene_type:complete
MTPKVKFLNHASFSIENEDSLTLVDPWYFGRIFNKSWSLLRDTDDSQIDYTQLKYISISHEHPDHLHWATLKHIRSKTENEVTIIYPRRRNPNVKEACEKLGFKFVYLDYFVETPIANNYNITVFPEGHDSAIVYRINDKIIINQNDAYLNWEVLQHMKGMFPKIDLWLSQFSLAGYYGNSTEPETIITKGTKWHIEKFLEYQNVLRPKMSIPFASYVYFCKEFNDYINDYAVGLRNLSDLCEHPLQIPFYNKELSFNSLEKNEEHLKKWDEVFKNSRQKITPVSEFVGEKTIIEKFKELYKSGYRVGTLVLEFFDYDKNLLIDTNSQIFTFLEKENSPSNIAAGKLPSEELLAYLDTPWGGDTLNITGAFIKRNHNLWTNFLMAREQLYQR